MMNINLRDIAARNCFLRLASLDQTKNITVKIGDFGLSKENYADNFYKIKTSRSFPVRWMAPESLNKGIFTNKSDVW